MNAKRWSFLAILLCVANSLLGEQAQTNRESFAEIKSKAEGGDAKAQYQLGYYYGSDAVAWTNGALAVDTNSWQLAAEWYRKAAEVGYAPAQCALGDCYAYGHGVPKDVDEALKWYRKSADQGNGAAQFELGLAYYQGTIVSQDLPEAMKWFRKAAEQNDLMQAEEQFGIMFRNGEGVMKDWYEAVKWYRKAAEQGSFMAQGVLGLAYTSGDGVPINYIEAYKWSNLALGNGDWLSKDNLQFLEQKMTPEEIAEAQRLSKAFVPRKRGQKLISDNSISSDQPVASGTGFFITEDGYLISNYHVVKDAARVRLLTGAGMVDAQVAQVDAANDLALLKAEGHFAALPVASSRGMALGGTVATVGFPDPGLQGFSPKLAKGEIAALAGAADDARYFQISVPVQPGNNSGGALVDERGNVVGIVSAKLDAATALAASGALPENVNYAVKSSFLLSFLESVPGVETKLKKPNTADEKFEDVVKQAQAATVLVLVY
jgi:TPR repeat protein